MQRMVIIKIPTLVLFLHTLEGISFSAISYLLSVSYQLLVSPLLSDLTGTDVNVGTNATDGRSGGGAFVDAVKNLIV
jgi:hypothetical protein